VGNHHFTAFRYHDFCCDLCPSRIDGSLQENAAAALKPKPPPCKCGEEQKFIGAALTQPAGPPSQVQAGHPDRKGLP
jgi:hypothetical protein